MHSTLEGCKKVFYWCENTRFLFMSDADKRKSEGYNLRLLNMDERFMVNVLTVRRTMKRRMMRRAGEFRVKMCW